MQNLEERTEGENFLDDLFGGTERDRKHPSELNDCDEVLLN